MNCKGIKFADVKSSHLRESHLNEVRWRFLKMGVWYRVTEAFGVILLSNMYGIVSEYFSSLKLSILQHQLKTLKFLVWQMVSAK